MRTPRAASQAERPRTGDLPYRFGHTQHARDRSLSHTHRQNMHISTRQPDHKPTLPCPSHIRICHFHLVRSTHNTWFPQHVFSRLSPKSIATKHVTKREESRGHVIYSLAQNTKRRRVGGATLSTKHKHTTQTCNRLTAQTRASPCSCARYSRRRIPRQGRTRSVLDRHLQV